MTSHQPHLLQDLRMALGVLYSLPLVAHPHVLKPSSGAAHEYLMQFQSRNIRRKLLSLAKSQHQKQSEDTTAAAPVPTLEAEDYGSTWLCCLALLASLTSHEQTEPKVNYAEALFAAQTLVHRLRRVKASEAIDLEFEPPIHAVPPNPNHLVEAYIFWIEKIDPRMKVVLQQYAPNTDDEECIKGELMMISLMVILYRVTLSYFSEISRIRPLLSTLASAISVTAARLRFTSSSIPNPSPNTQPIVTMILHTLGMVRQTVATTAEDSPEHQAAAYIYVFYTCMSVVPDAILAGSGSGGAAHGRMSMDPRCYTAVTTEVRTQGITQVWESFADLPTPEGDHLVLFFHMCEEWAKHAPLPLEFVQRSLPSVEASFAAAAGQHISHENIAAAKAAMCYWTAVMEAGSWTVDKVLSASLIQKNENSQQLNKKKQSSKSKKRQKEVLDERTTANQLVLAQNEVHHRGHVAIETTKITWSAFRVLLTQELAHVQDVEDEVPGDGPVGGITACANACLSYIIRQPSHTKELIDLFRSIGHGIQEICGNPSRMVRSFAAETLYMLHEAVVEVLSIGDRSFGNELDTALVEHFFHCSMNLALRCCYPPDYFCDLGANNDEDLESERNEVRDVLRTVSGTTTSEGKTTTSVIAKTLTSTVLLRLLSACAEPILMQPTDTRSLYPETAIHAFSALARSLISAASSYSRAVNDAEAEILTLSLNILTTAGVRLTNAFGVISVSESLPMSRLYNLAVASLAPMLSMLCRVAQFESLVGRAMKVCIQAAMASLAHVPELAAPSTLRSTRYDIRGAMRTPGGEDHAGVLALMRLAMESEELSYLFIRTDESTGKNMCELYQHLKHLEEQRGRGVLHGQGLLPKSRRILLGVICHLEMTTRGSAGTSELLRNIFNTSVGSIVSLGQSNHISVDVLCQMAEHVFDVAAFSPEMISTLFYFSLEETSSPRATCLRVLLEAGLFGFQASVDSSIPQELIYEWNRLRAALFCLFKSSGCPDLPTSVLGPLNSWICRECDAITSQCDLGPRSSSRFFVDDIISEETVPAGIFVQVIGEVLARATSTGVPLSAMPNTIKALFECRTKVLRTISSTCSNPIEKGSFCDPRPTLTEAWILTTIRLMNGFDSLCQMPDLAQGAKQIIVETCVASVSLLFFPSLGKTQEKRANDPGFSMDGPHMLVMMDFFQTYFSLGPAMLQAVATELLSAIPIDIQSIQPCNRESAAAGIAIFVAAIFRAAQGGLPPWAVECVPPIYSALYTALEKSPENFALVIQTSMRVRLVHDRSFGGVLPGQLLSGRFFDSMGEKAKHTFVVQAAEIAHTNTPASWKRLKALVKQACGGKKKDTDFKQRPALTKYDSMDRV